jgi:hypothetical protein
MLDEAHIQALLQDLPERAIRSGLEPYRELLVLELRRRSFSYRQIAKLLAERCGFEISHSAIHDFVRKHGAMPPLVKPRGAEEPPVTSAPSTSPEQRGADSSIRERIEALKRQKPAPQAEETGFRFDPAKPLHLEE